MADGGIAIVLVVSFSLVVAASSIYIVNERVSGEKLQQQLCNVTFRTYWGVSFLWDFSVRCVNPSDFNFFFKFSNSFL